MTIKPPQIEWADFERMELRVGTIVKAQVFENAKKPAYQIWADFGPLGVKKSSAQITHHYTCESLIGMQIVAVTNFAPKQIANFMSEFLVTGFADENGHIVLTQPNMPVGNGVRMG